MISKSTIGSVLDACEAALIAQGFSRLRKHQVALEISEDFLGWVGLNYGIFSSGVRVNPFVGVHCIPVMKLIDSLSGEKYQRGRYATFAVSLGELCPNEDAFIFSKEDDLLVQSERLALTLKKFAVPYMQGLASYEALLPKLVDLVPTLGGYPQRVAAALYLMDQPVEAREFVLARQAEYADDEEIVRDRFDRFAVPFLRMLGR